MNVRPLRELVGVLAAAALAGAFLYLDVAQTLRAEAALPAARGAAITLLWAAGALGSGSLLLNKLAPATLAGAAGPLHAFALGTGAQASLLTALAFGGRAQFPAFIAVLALGLAPLLTAQPRLIVKRAVAGVTRLGPAGLGLGAALLLPGAVEALAPPTDTDIIYQHLALARRIAEEGSLLGGFDHPDGSRPLPVHLLYAALWGLGGECAPGLWHLGLAAAVLLGVIRLGEARFGGGPAWMGALALLGSWTFLREAGLPYNNLPTALWVLTAVDALLGRNADDPAPLRWMGLSAGLGMAAKYTAAPALAGLALAALYTTPRRHWPALAAGGVLALLAVAPWPARNVLSGLHPFFPYAGWPDSSGLTFMYAEKYGLGRDGAAFGMLPWNLLMRADTESWAFFGRISLVWAALLTVGPLHRWRERPVRVLGLVVAAGFGGWALGPHWMRYLLPIAPVAAVLGATLRPGIGAWLLLLVSLPANLLPAWRSAEDRIAVVLGHEKRADFLKRSLPAGEALAWLETEVPAGAPVAQLFSWYGYYVPQPWRLGSVEDHVPTRFWLWSHPESPLGDLYDEGVRYLLVGESPFLRSQYRFLSDPEYEREFGSYERRLDRALLARATRLMGARGFSVYRIDPPTGVDASGSSE